RYPYLTHTKAAASRRTPKCPLARLGFFLTFTGWCDLFARFDKIVKPVMEVACDRNYGIWGLLRTDHSLIALVSLAPYTGLGSWDFSAGRITGFSPAVRNVGSPLKTCWPDHTSLASFS
ncbi:MAG: hypothetical protein PHQ75_10070, partial [Thermoguttaceae bacterium]|nr:hypothetical protein [Thermoguttaceae bacterium]